MPLRVLEFVVMPIADGTTAALASHRQRLVRTSKGEANRIPTCEVNHAGTRSDPDRGDVRWWRWWQGWLVTSAEGLEAVPVRRNPNPTEGGETQWKRL